MMKSQSVLLTITVLLIPAGWAAAYSDGSGTAENPYQISTPQDMNEIGAHPNNWDSYFVMVNDINLAEYTGTQFNIIGCFEGWGDPNNKPFTGVFDGNGHTISNFTYTATATDDIGLFGYVNDANALIKDLTLVTPDVNAAGNSWRVGGLVGCLEYGTISGCGIEGGSVTGAVVTGGLVGNNEGTITNCHSVASVTGNWATGGLVGSNTGTISDCHAEGSVMGNEWTGGLVGDNSATISNCYSIASVSGGDYTGGLVGENWEGTISNCHAAGSVTGYEDTGGLVGSNDATISNCYAEGSVTGEGFSTGGLVGENYGGTISNCYAEGSVEGDSSTGGLVGANYGGTISNCYATDSITGFLGTGGLLGYNENGIILNCYAAGSVSGTGIIGGLVGGDNGGSYTSCFWDQTVNPSLTGIDNIDDPPGVIGESTANMQKADTFVYAAWSICGNGGVWTIDDGNDYPRLSWQNLPGQPLPSFSELLQGTGSEEQPYLVRTAEQLNLIGLSICDCEWDKHFRLVADINLSDYTGTEFNIIGNDVNAFTGVFDGNGHTISNFTYTTTDTSYIGLFGYVDDANAAIKDLTLINPNVNAAGEYSDYIGCLVGRLYGTITGCGIEGGSVTGHYRTGGLVGQSYEGTIANCSVSGDVSGSKLAGGLVGDNSDGIISNCYATGGVTGRWEYIGGLVGYNWGMISNCHAEGGVTGEWDYTGGLVGGNGSNGTVTNCYAEGSVSGYFCTGGLVGANYFLGAISNCYATGSVSGSSSTGGLVGGGVNVNGWGVVNCFWDIEIGGPDNGIGTPLPTSQMQTESTFTDAGWDFIGETTNGIEDIWRLCEDTIDYPKLTWQMIMLGDFVCPDGVEFNDLDVFMQQWLMEKLSADVAVGGGDGIVDLIDWAVLADGWQNTADLNDVADFADQWLLFGAYCADIAPTPAGDGVVDMLDFAVFAEHWLEAVLN